ncbi:UNVERIFIED_CONTAM: hypothetical protein Slati_0434500 [Sesamum latifolium]|uniref:Reverse transcriptase n=1 Tax=Sesamum latifolium TaxID=2727402 RepID=A0AAW2XVP7_9LAMI
MEGNQEITNPNQIRDSTASHFENLLSGHVTQSGTPDFPFQFSKIPEEVGHNICSIPSEEDIKEIVFSIDKESVAGPDGFSSTFYQACWEFIARDIYDAVRDFFSGTLCHPASQLLLLFSSRRWTPLRSGTISGISPCAINKFCQSSSIGRFLKSSRT